MCGSPGISGCAKPLARCAASSSLELRRVLAVGEDLEVGVDPDVGRDVGVAVVVVVREELVEGVVEVLLSLLPVEEAPGLTSIHAG